ncbi:MAG: aminotransferase class V-fold PLP-dependent enzyme [Acutalibacter sp.]
MIYLDNSATTYPKPQGVRQAVQRAFTDYGANPGRSGYGMCLRTTQAVYQVRQQAAEFFGAPGPECVLFQPSCTQALNVVLKGFLKPGDHVVITDLEHNAVTRPLEALKARGVTYTVAKVTPGDNDATVNAFRQAIGPKTRLAVCTMASNVFGIRVPVERIAALCHQYDVALCVDAAQGAGLFPIHMGESGIDYLCCAGHKGLYGPMGTGLLLVREPERLLGTLVEGGTGTQSRSFQMPQEAPERYESGTVNVPGILGLGAGLEFVRRRGVERICQEELQKLRYLHGRLSRLGKVTLYTPPPEERFSAPVLSFNLEGIPRAGGGVPGPGDCRALQPAPPLAHGWAPWRQAPCGCPPRPLPGRRTWTPWPPGSPGGGNKFRESRKNFFYLRFFYAIIFCRKP